MYKCIKHKMLVYSVNVQIEITISTTVLVKILMKYDKFEFTFSNGGGDQNL
jgi:hypothetical protein